MKKEFAAFALSALVFSGCGGRDTVAGPSPVTLDPKPKSANIVTKPGTSLRYTCINAGFFITCDWTVQGKNIGNGCATSVTGMVQLYDAKNQPVAYDTFIYMTGFRVAPGEEFYVSGDAIGKMSLESATRTEVTWHWKDVDCDEYH